jgi:hypothetical protein
MKRRLVMYENLLLNGSIVRAVRARSDYDVNEIGIVIGVNNSDCSLHYTVLFPSGPREVGWSLIEVYE